MNVIIYPGLVNGNILAKPSKSIAQRAIIASMLAKGISYIHNCSVSEDVLNLINLIENAGFRIVQDKHVLKIWGGHMPESMSLNVGESGLAARLLIPVLATYKEHFRVEGIGSLLQRPFDQFSLIFKKAGVQYSIHNGKLPAYVKGPLKSGTHTIDASIGSQFLSGLLFAFPLLEGQTQLKVDSLKSKPYIDMTIDMLQKFGVTVTHDNYSLFIIEGRQIYKPSRIRVENDWSNAAFLLVSAAIGGYLQLEGLNRDSKQGDKAILDVLAQAGASLQVSENYISCEKKQLKAFEFDATHYPDLFPPLVALASNCLGISKIKGVHRLVYKESNRSHALIQEYGKLGISIELKEDTMYITGGKVKSADVNSWNDHRIAMSLAVAALSAEGKVIIHNFDCVKKSYPEFLVDFKSVGVNIS